MFASFFFELSREDCFGHAHVIHLAIWPAQCSCTWNKMDSVLGRLAFLRFHMCFFSFDVKDRTQVKLLKKPDLHLAEDPSLCTIQENKNNDSFVLQNLHGAAECYIPYSALLSLTLFQRSCWLWKVVIKVLSDYGINEDDSTQVKIVFQSVLRWGWCHWYWSQEDSWHLMEGICAKRNVFLRLMVWPKIFAAPEKKLTMCCKASFGWVRRVQLLTNSSSVMSSSMGFFVC